MLLTVSIVKIRHEKKIREFLTKKSPRVHVILYKLTHMFCSFNIQLIILKKKKNAHPTLSTLEVDGVNFLI